MTILGVGVDVLQLSRLASLMSRRTPERMALRILNSHELRLWSALPPSDDAQRMRYIAVRWAIKEAAYKAIYHAVKPTWKELSYRTTEGQGSKPFLIYEPLDIAEAVKLGRLHASVSHDGDYVFATVIAETREDALSHVSRYLNLQPLHERARLKLS